MEILALLTHKVRMMKETLTEMKKTRRTNQPYMYLAVFR